MNRTQDALDILNNSGVAQQLGTLQRAMVLSATRAILGLSAAPTEEQSEKENTRFLLNSIGPAAASCLVDQAISSCRSRGQLQKLHLNGNYVNNVKQILGNDTPSEDSNNFSTTLRQFLLPRYAYLDFDTLVDPRHMIDLECGYPKFITPIMYRHMYDRDDMARRVNDIYPDESWAVNPLIYEDDDEENVTKFEERWSDLCEDHNLIQYLYRIDKLSGVGHYGILLLGLDDNEDLATPVNEPGFLAGTKNYISKKQRDLLYLRPFDEYLCFIQEYDTDTSSPRHGFPLYYNLVFLDATIGSAGASTGTRVNRRVHWSRVVHIADGLGTSDVMGIPRQQPVFNRLLDLRKVKGGGAEMFWKGAFPGISFEIDPKFVADNPEFDEEKFRAEIDNYASGLQRYLRLVGISAKSLAPSLCESPEKYVMIQVQAIASHYGVPIRVFLGSEEGKLASDQDKLTWNQRLGRRLMHHVEPNIIRKVINHFIGLGIMPAPTKNGKRGRYKYFVDWSDLNTTTDEDKANLSLKLTQALSQYVASGVIHLVPPMEYFTGIMGMRPQDAKRVIAAAEKQGGFAKLAKVDPSQGAGQNGVRENQVSKGDTTGSAHSRPKKRNTADKKAEGKTS